jgi:aspartate 1-decarboxylase
VRGAAGAPAAVDGRSRRRYHDYESEDETMDRVMLKSKIHRATVTGADLHYEGSTAIDEALLEAADILPGEQIHVFNINNGERFVTYAIKAPRGSGTILLNGAAARRGQPGDLVIIVSFAHVADAGARAWKPRVVHVDQRNRATRG